MLTALPAFISAAGSLLGGVLGGKKDRRFAADQSTLEYQRQKEFAQHGIQWRVEDAQAAGLHPLYALSGGGATYSPSAVTTDFSGTYQKMGQDLGRAAAATMTREQRDEEMEKLGLLRAQRARTEAETIEIYDRMQRLSQPHVGSPFPSDVVVGAYRGSGNIESHPLFKDAVKLSPDEMVSRSASQGGETAGQSHPGLREFQLKGNYKLLLPATGQGGIPEEIDATMVPFIIGSNVARYGYRWLVDTLGYFQGVTPDDRRGRTIESLLGRAVRDMAGRNPGRPASVPDAMKYRGMR